MTPAIHVRSFRVAVEPVEAFRRLAHRTGVFWLDSSLRRPGDGRFSVMGCEPRWVFIARNSDWRLERAGVIAENGSGDPIGRLDQMVASHRVTLRTDSGPEIPFTGGAVGFFSYDLGRHFERVEGTASADLEVPDIRLAWHDCAVVWDHEDNRLWVVGVDGERAADVAMRELEGWLGEPPDPKMWAGWPHPAIDSRAANASHPIATSDLTRDSYLAGVQAIRDSIARGEVYQANLVQRFTCSHPGAPAATYLRLRELNPAPFAAYQDAGEWAILSSSPERFIEVGPERRIRTCPIKGTRPRGRTDTEDRALAAELVASPKERAELLMIVDLLRNDLGRVCEYGSVKVTRLHALESFATVHHLVGEVIGQLRADVRLPQLLRAVMPGGSVTGAPKVSALRLIDRLEPHRRGVGMGAIGYVSAHGRIDLNIAIRTILCGNGQAHFHVGAGIVWDSNPVAEYEETLAKGRALFQALGVGGISA